MLDRHGISRLAFDEIVCDGVTIEAGHDRGPGLAGPKLRCDHRHRLFWRFGTRTACR
jgi:hypothetical protein